jgi:hypothetical protein
MAYVGISSALIEEVRAKISKMRNVEVAQLTEPPREIALATTTDEHLKMLWGEHFHLKDIIPNDWKHSVDTLCLNTKNTRHVIVSVRLRFASPAQLPPSVSPYRHHWPEIEVSSSNELLQERLQYSEQVSDIEARWTDIRVKVIEFLTSCKSLNEALKLWPDVQFYIPSGYMERVEKKVERTASQSKAQDVLKTIDTDAAVAAVVAARMVTANG